MQSQNPRLSSQWAERHHDAPALRKVGDRFDSAAGLIEVGDRSIPQDCKFLTIPFGRAVDQPLKIERCCRDE